MTEEKIGRRLELIMKVRSGLMTATEAAKQLGVSRKTYYQWEKKALAAMMEALTKKPTGRKARKVDTEKDALTEEVEKLRQENKNMESTIRLREMLTEDPYRWSSSSTDNHTKKKDSV